MVFTVTMLLLVAIASYYVGVSGRKSNQAQQSTRAIKKQLEYSINNSIEAEINEQLIACHIEKPEIANELAAKIKYEMAVLTKTGNGKYRGFVKISTGDIVKVNILEDDENFYCEAEDWTGLKSRVANERQKMGLKSDSEKKQEAIWKENAEFERRYIKPKYWVHQDAKATTAIADNNIVTAILYSKDTPSATIDGEVLREGQSIRGVRIIKIYKDSVEFERNSKRWKQATGESSDRYSDYWTIPEGYELITKPSVTENH
jgi:hypothetical protein